MKLQKGSVLTIVEWVFSVMFLITGLAFLFSYPVAGIFLLLIGLLLLPPLYSKLKHVIFKKAKYNITWWQRGIAILVLFILAITFTPKTGTSSTGANAYLKSNASSLASSKATISSSAPSSALASSTAPVQTSVNGNLTVDFIDVGQGDSELIRQGGQTMLIDSGPHESESKFMSFINSQGISEINYLVLTHPHEDHIGNATEILQKYKVDNLLMTSATTNTSTFEKLITTASSKKANGLKITNPKLGSTFSLSGAKCDVFGPVNPDMKDLNTCSIVLKITYGNTKFLFTGDSQTSNEAGMIGKGFDLSADVLKVGHHGSHTSSSQAFLSAVHPKYSIIEVGKGNSYGHPTQAVLDRLLKIGSQIFRTDEQGTIVCTSDGNTIKFDKASTPEKQQAPPSSSAVTQTPVPPVTQQAPTTDNSRTVYWTPGGKSYHYSRNCPTLSRSKTINSGTLAEAEAAGKNDPCDKCVK